jgi:hypothetical protein
MPIQCDLSIPCLSDDEFEVIDKAVMTCAYAAQNKLGRKTPAHPPPTRWRPENRAA